jgi:hypothetical protein
MSIIKIKPWISENYLNKQNGEERVLLLGESHYGEQTDTIMNFTNEVIQDVIDGTICSGYRYYTMLGKLFNESDRSEIFMNCAFSNLIQTILEKPRKNPSKEELDTIHDAFWEILRITKPTKVIVTSQRAWEYWLPDGHPRGQRISDISVNNRYTTVWHYRFDDVDCKAIGIGHPSSRNFYSWRGVVNEFLAVQ